MLSTTGLERIAARTEDKTGYLLAVEDVLLPLHPLSSTRGRRALAGSAVFLVGAS